MIQSGIAPLDERLGGLAPGRIHLVTGGLGAGKTAACLHFIGGALDEGERAAMLTGDRGSDLKALASYLGIDIDTPLRDGRLQLIRYRPEFSARFSHSSSPERAIADLRAMIGANAPTRIAIDPLDPFLGEGGPVTAGALALVNFLEELGATALLTHPADTADNADRRLDPIIARSVAVVRLERGHGNVHYLGVVRARVPDIPSAPIAFQIRRGAGIERYQGARPSQAREIRSASGSSRKLLVLHITKAAPTDIIGLLKRDYETVIRPAPAAGAALDLAATGIDAIVVAVSHDSVAEAISLITTLNERPDVVPIILAARFNLRSIDRARALRAGADDILATDMAPDEFLQRLASASSRAHALRRWRATCRTTTQRSTRWSRSHSIPMRSIERRRRFPTASSWTWSCARVESAVEISSRRSTIGWRSIFTGRVRITPRSSSIAFADSGPRASADR
jgi:KaiC/GvpD/RAD55 family RecA-like ATPase/CheY-like chemotaxis protein